MALTANTVTLGKDIQSIIQDFMTLQQNGTITPETAEQAAANMWTLVMTKIMMYITQNAQITTTVSTVVSGAAGPYPVVGTGTGTGTGLPGSGIV